MLDPYKEAIKGMLEKHGYSCEQVYQKLRKMGYPGGRSILKEYIRKIRPASTKAYLELHFDKGECAQVDWGSYGTIRTGQRRRKLSFFVMVLCYSRMIYVMFTVKETMEQFLECHKRAFEFFGCVPGKIMQDNLKTAVLEHKRGMPPVFHPRYLDFAHHYGFTAIACGVRQPRDKGRCESGVGYVKKNFLNGHEHTSLSSVQSAAAIWRDTVANVRIHGTTAEPPIERFEQEKPFMLPLNETPYDTSVLLNIRANSQFKITIDTNRYSVPWRYASKRVQVKLTMDQVRIFNEESMLIASHARSYDHRQRIEHPDHVKDLLIHRKKARDNQLLYRFLALHPCAEAYYRNLQQRPFNARIHVRKIMALHDIHGTDAVVRALQTALDFEAFSSDYIAHLLSMARIMQAETGPLSLSIETDALELDIEAPDMSIYEPNTEGDPS